MRFLNTLVCVGLILATFGVPSTAQSQGQQRQVQFLDDADSAAYIWAKENPTKIAVSIHVGAETNVNRATIEYWIRRDFRDSAVNNVQFFYERGGSRGSSLAYVTRNHVYGPFALAQSREQISEIAAQLTFEIRRGLH